MKKIINIIIIGILFMNNSSIAQLNILQEAIINEFKNVKGDFALAFKDLSDGKNIILINEKEKFHAASTMKTPVMIEVFKQSAAGKFSVDDLLTVKNEFKSIVDGSTYSMDISRDSGDSLYDFIGKKVSIRKLVFDMITVSSNLATNIVIDLVDAKNVMETMKEIGANDIKVLRGVEDMKAYDIGLNNSTTAFDLMLIYEKIATGEIVSSSACDEMTNILTSQKFRQRIPGKLPEDLKVAHKTGSITGVQHDSGFVILPDGRKYVIVLLSKNLEVTDDGVEVLSNVSKMIYDFMMEK